MCCIVYFMSFEKLWKEIVRVSWVFASQNVSKELAFSVRKICYCPCSIYSTKTHICLWSNRLSIAAERHLLSTRVRVLVTPAYSRELAEGARERPHWFFCSIRPLKPLKLSKTNSRTMAKKKTKTAGKKPVETEEDIESEKKKFSCPYCDQAFSRKYDMEKHQRKHTGDKPYKCGICGKQFVQVGSLAVHMRSHTGEMPYSCEECGKGFAVKERLRLHQRTHTGNYRFFGFKN